MNDIDAFVVKWVTDNGIVHFADYPILLSPLNRPGRMNYPVLMKNWQSVHTLGYGTCLIYAFLGAASPTYRSLSVKNQLAVGLELRAYLSTNPRGFNATPLEIQSLQNFLGETSEGISLMEELQDSLAERIADFFQFSLIMLNEYNNLDIPVPQVRDLERGYPVIIIRIRGGFLSLEGSQSGEHYETVVIPQYQGVLQFIHPSSLCKEVIPIMNETMELAGALIDKRIAVPEDQSASFALTRQLQEQGWPAEARQPSLPPQAKSASDDAASLALISRLQAQASAASDDAASLALIRRLQAQGSSPAASDDAASLALARQLQAQGSSPAASDDAASLALARQLQSQETPAATKSWKCTHCGWIGSEGRQYCSRCGAPRVQQQATENLPYREINCYAKGKVGTMDLQTAKIYAKSAGIEHPSGLHKPQLCKALAEKGVFVHNGERVKIIYHEGKRVSRKRNRRILKHSLKK